MWSTSVTEERSASGTTPAARIERPGVARVFLDGSDATDFLQRITSNDVAVLREGEGCPTLLLERTGRFVDRLIAGDTGDGFLLVGSPGRGDAVHAFLDRYVIAEDVRVRDLRDSTVLITVAGGDAGAVLGRALGMDVADLPPWHHRTGPGGVRVIRAEHVGGGAFHVVAPSEAGASVNDALAAMPEMDAGTWRTLRILAGVPEFGEEYGDRTIALETRMFDAISFTKGCYVGQEVIARLHNHNRVKRALVRVRLQVRQTPARGAALAAGDEDVGEVVSAAAGGDGVIALAYVKVGCEAAGTELTLRDGKRAHAALVLPPALAGDAE